MPRASILDYFGDIQARIITSQFAVQIGIRPIVRQDDKYRGGVAGRLDFQDGGVLTVAEEVRINSITDEVEIVKYSYTYRGTYKNNPDFFFRYEMDKDASLNPDGTKRIAHPEFHLHANDNDLRYMTHKTSLIEVFEFVCACFYTI